MSFLYTAITSLYSEREIRPFVCTPGTRSMLTVHMLKDLLRDNEQSVLHIPGVMIHECM